MMTNRFILSVLLVGFLILTYWIVGKYKSLFLFPRSTFSCPTYESIVDASMKAFDMNEMSGIWYMLATTEPTMPFYCHCAVLNYSIYDTWYLYTGQFNCLGVNVSLDSIGTLSKNISTPGYLHEGLSLFHTAVTSLEPYYIFSVERTTTDFSEQKLMNVHFYGCVSKLFKLFSYNLLSRTPYVSLSKIEDMVNIDKKKYEGIFDFSNLRYMDIDAYHKCGVFS